MSVTTATGVRKIAIAVLQALADITDVDLTSPSDGQVLTYDSSSGKWINGAPAATGVNITADTHPSSPTIYDDEFEYGVSIDTSGARFPDAQAWSWVNQGSSTGAVAEGSLILLAQLTSSFSISLVNQPLPAGSWTYTTKVSISGTVSSAQGGLIVGAASGKYLTLGLYLNGANQSGFLMQRQTNTTTTSATEFTVGSLPAAEIDSNTTTGTSSQNAYLQIAYDGTNFEFFASLSGIPGTFYKFYTEAASTFLGTPATIGLYCLSQSASINGVLVCDWFRKTA